MAPIARPHPVSGHRWVRSSGRPAGRTSRGAPVDDEGELSALYAASWRLFRVLELVIPRQRLWEIDTWEALHRALEELGEPGERIRAVLDGGAEAQRAALGDDDHDGLVTMHEEILGTSPAAWDSDGDGWWDGAPVPPPYAVPVARDGTPACVPFVDPSGNTRWIVDGDLRGFDLASEKVDLGRNASPTLSYSDDLEPSPRCAWRPGATVWSAEPRSVEQLEQLAAGLVETEARFAQRFGPPRARVVATVVDDGVGLRLVRGTAAVSVTVPQRLLTAQGPQLYAQIVALHRVAPVGFREPNAAAVALARHVDDVRYRPLVERTFGPDVRRFGSLVAQCGSGWEGMLEGDCRELYRY